MRMSDWSSDVCAADLQVATARRHGGLVILAGRQQHRRPAPVEIAVDDNLAAVQHRADPAGRQVVEAQRAPRQQGAQKLCRAGIAAAEPPRSEEHTSELQSLMRNSYAVFCLKKKNEIQSKEST